MNREEITLSKEDARPIAYGDAPEGFKIIENTIVDTGRWSIHHSVIIQRLSDGKFFRGGYSEGATEQQDERPWEYEEPEFTEVFPVEKKVIVYE